MRTLVFGLALLASTAASAQVLDTPVKGDDYWGMGRSVIQNRLKVVHRPQKAKNVVLLIGDGMGVPTVTAARIFAGQYPDDGSPRRTGEENVLAFETLPHLALVKTYNTNAQVSDSAGTASAMNTGIKTRIGYINFASNQTADDCRSPEKLPRTLAEIAKGQGMAVGVVTTTRVTHATPAAVYAHVPNRNWEGADRTFPAAERAKGCKDIATQLVEFAPRGASGTGLDVVLAGGTNQFLPVEAGGRRDDGKDLVAAWKTRFPAGKYVADAGAFRALSPSANGPVLGLFNKDHLSFEFDRDKAKEPSLSEMTAFALEKLARSGKGYYLMIEGGRIDHAHHASNAYRALSETQQFARTVETVLKTVNLDDTLVLVTADHSHTLSFAGYPERGNDILGYIKSSRDGEGSGPVSPEGFALDDRGQPMTTLSYANGPFVAPPLSRTLAPNDPNFLSPKTFGTSGESHGGEDVALYAAGPRSHLVGGVIEQNVIFHVIAEALGWR